jgi:Protein of unknown function (DUF3096)
MIGKMNRPLMEPPSLAATRTLTRGILRTRACRHPRGASTRDEHNGPRSAHDLHSATMAPRPHHRAWRRDPIIEVRSRPEGMERTMAVNVIFLQPLIALVAGILILIMPRLLNYIVAIYLILVGLAGLLPQLSG